MRFYILRGKRGDFFRMLCGVAIVTMFIIIIFFAEYVAPYDPNQCTRNALMPPSNKHLMGTDILGRDILSRILFGARTSTSVAILAVGIAIAVGVPLGLMSGYLGGLLDRLLTMVMDTLYSFPLFILAALMATMLGRGIVNTAMAVAIVSIPNYFRVVRSITTSTKELQFIEAEKALGASKKIIMFRHILPYSIPSILVIMSMGIADSILSVAGLGFLGLGIPPPTSEWGTDLEFGREVITSGVWWPSVFPGIMILLATFSFNIVGETLDSILKKES